VLATSLSIDHFFPGEGSTISALPITLAWWYFITRVSVEYLMQGYLEAVPLHIQTILGQQNFDLDDLLRLRGNWKDCSLGVYLNILTKAGQVWYRLYVGSATATSKKTTGFWSRIRTHYNWTKIRMDPAKREKVRKTNGAHGRAVLDPEVQIQFVKLAIFSTNTPKIYILFFETLMMIFLQVFKSRKVSTHVPAICYDWAEQCQPKDVLNIDSSIGLNNAWTLKQPAGRKAVKGTICSHCRGQKNETRHGKKLGWHHRDPTKPYRDMLCYSCYKTRRKFGQLPPLAKVDGVIRRMPLRYKPEWHVHHCVSCGTGKIAVRPDSAVDGKNRCAACRGNLQGALERNEAGKYSRIGNRDEMIAHYSRNEFPSEAPVTDPATDPEPLCAHCGKVVKRNMPPTKVDGKIRHLSCQKRMVKDLKILEETPQEKAHVPRFKDRETLIAHYSSFGVDFGAANKGANHRLYNADEHVHPCVTCNNPQRATRPHGPDDKHRCVTCRTNMDRALEIFKKGKSKSPNIESFLVRFCKYEASSSSS